MAHTHFEVQLLVARGHEGLRSLDGERVLLDLVGPVVQSVLQRERCPHDAVGGHRRRRVKAAQTNLWQGFWRSTPNYKTPLQVFFCIEFMMEL